MAPVNQSWTSFQNIDLENDHAKKIQTVLQSENFSYLCSRAVEIRKQGEVRTRPRHTCLLGGYNKIYQWSMQCGGCPKLFRLTQWVARVMSPQDREDGDIPISLLSEISTMKLIFTKTTIPVPHAFGYCVTTSDIGYPYLLMEALPGKVLDSRMALSIPDKHKRNFAALLASYIYELSTIRSSQICRMLCS